MLFSTLCSNLFEKNAEERSHWSPRIKITASSLSLPRLPKGNGKTIGKRWWTIVMDDMIEND